MSEEEKLPFDIQTLLIGIWLRKYVLLGGMVISLIVAGALGYFIGTQLYTAETVLFYQPILKSEESSASQPLNTFLHLVKIQSNLEETRSRLELSVDTASLGASINVFLKKNTDLMVIRANWTKAKETADIANTIRDVFLENHGKMLSGNWLISKLTSVDQRYQETMLQKKALDKQESNLDRIIVELRDRIKKEQKETRELESLGNLNIRVSQLQKTIATDKAHRTNLAALAKSKLVLDRAKLLYDQRAITKPEYEIAKAEYKRQKALTIDTKQSKKWKEELKEMNESILPSGTKSTASSPILSEMMLKVFELQLEKVSMTEKLSILEHSRSQLTERLRILQSEQEESENSKKGTITPEKIDWASMSSDKRLTALSQTTGFKIVSSAAVPVYPQKSNRKIIFLAVAFLGFFFSMVLVLALELLDTTVKSEADLKIKFEYPVLGFVPLLPADANVFPESENDSEVIEYFRPIARKVKEEIKKRGARIMVISINHNEGSSSVIANLSACLGRLDERVLMLDAQVRHTKDSTPLANLIEKEIEEPKGLGEFLSYEFNDIDEIIHPTIIPGVMCLPSIGKAVIPDLIGSGRMKELLDEVSENYSIILVDAPPAFPLFDAGFLTNSMDMALVIVESKKTKMGLIKNSLEQIEKFSECKIGFVLNKVSKYYAKKT